MPGNIKDKNCLLKEEFFTYYTSASFIPQETDFLCPHAVFWGLVSHRGSSVTHTWRGRVGGGVGLVQRPC